MMTRWLLILATCVASSVAAQAQESPVDSYFKVWSSSRAQENLRKQAVCAVKKYPADARSVVVGELEMRVIINSMPDLMKPCFSGSLFKDNNISISQPVYGFALAEALIGDLSTIPPLDSVDTAPPLSREPAPSDISALPPKMREDAEIILAMFNLDVGVECAVRRDPNGAWTLATAQHGSDLEQLKLEQMQAAVRACNVSSPDVPSFILRGTVAYNLYRLLDAAHLVGKGKERVSA